MKGFSLKELKTSYDEKTIALLQGHLKEYKNEAQIFIAEIQAFLKSKKINVQISKKKINWTEFHRKFQWHVTSAERHEFVFDKKNKDCTPINGFEPTIIKLKIGSKIHWIAIIPRVITAIKSRIYTWFHTAGAKNIPGKKPLESYLTNYDSMKDIKDKALLPTLEAAGINI